MNADQLSQALVIVFAFYLLAIFFYIYLKRLPGIKISHAFAILLACRLIDSASFWWASESAGWKNLAAVEINPLHSGLIDLFPSASGLLLSSAINIGLILLIAFIYYLVAFWLRLKPRLTLTILAAFSSLSLTGAAASIGIVLGLWR